MASVALDADVLIAFLDAADAQHARAVAAVRPRVAAGDEPLVGASVYAEVMVQPLKRAAGDVVDEFLNAIGARVVPVDRTVARRAAELRARHRSLRLPDALSLAAALISGADFLTLDERLRRVSTREATNG